MQRPQHHTLVYMVSCCGSLAHTRKPSANPLKTQNLGKDVLWVVSTDYIVLFTFGTQYRWGLHYILIGGYTKLSYLQTRTLVKWSMEGACGSCSIRPGLRAPPQWRLTAGTRWALSLAGNYRRTQGLSGQLGFCPRKEHQLY